MERVEVYSRREGWGKKLTYILYSIWEGINNKKYLLVEIFHKGGGVPFLLCGTLNLFVFILKSFPVNVFMAREVVELELSAC